MTQKELDHIRKRDRWRETIADQKASGLTVIEYCNQKGISPHAFRHWRTAITRELLAEAAMVGVLKTPSEMAGANEVAKTASEMVVSLVGTEPTYGKLTQEIKKMAVSAVLAKTKYGCVEFTLRDARQLANLSHPLAIKLVHWLEQQKIIGEQHSGLKHRTRKVYITAEQWDQIAEKVLNDEGDALSLAQSLQPISAHVEPVAEAKNIDTQQELSVDGVVFDMEHNRLYVPGNATEQTIGVAINILRGLIPQPAVAAPVLT